MAVFHLPKDDKAALAPAAERQASATRAQVGAIRLKPAGLQFIVGER